MQLDLQARITGIGQSVGAICEISDMYHTWQGKNYCPYHSPIERLGLEGASKDHLLEHSCRQQVCLSLEKVDPLHPV